MFKRLKENLRTRLVGRSLRQQITDDHQTLACLGNRHYQEHFPKLTAPTFASSLEAYEFSSFSQNGEDGIILQLLARIGVSHRHIVEIGTENGRECNSANLILNFGWRACLVEMNPISTASARDYFTTRVGDDRVQVFNATATPENIIGILQQAQLPSELDVLSIDIDSHDYWLWRAIDNLRPRLVIIEYNATFGPERTVTVPYPMPSNQHRFYHGASLSALHALGQEKGYVLVGCDSHGVNAFFVRRDLAATNHISEVAPARAFRSHRRRSRKLDQNAQYELVKNFPLIEI